MIPSPAGLSIPEILNTTFIFDRTDIYRRFRCISELHTGEKQEQGAKGFFVGREYEINSDNLFKLEVQNFNTRFPRYFYSERYNLSGRKSKEVKADFPLVFMTAGDRNFTDRPDRKRSSYEFDFIVFDLMYYDRNNKTGNETALRELPEIWRDTEKILLEILEAYQNSGELELYNFCLSGEYLGYPEDLSVWTLEQKETAQALTKKIMCSNNFSLDIVSSIMPFEYKHNKSLAGVHTVIKSEIFTGCSDGQFKQIIC